MLAQCWGMPGSTLSKWLHAGASNPYRVWRGRIGRGILLSTDTWANMVGRSSSFPFFHLLCGLLGSGRLLAVGWTNNITCYETIAWTIFWPGKAKQMQYSPSPRCQPHERSCSVISHRAAIPWRKLNSVLIAWRHGSASLSEFKY